MEMVVYSMTSFLLIAIMVLFLWLLPILNPLPLSLSLILLALLTAGLSSSILSKWFSYAILLVFLGGMMVIFLYVSSLSLSSKNLFPAIPWFHLGLLLVVLFTSMAPLEEQWLLFDQWVSPSYQAISSGTLLFMVAYLLITLFCVVKITESFKGALLKKW